MLATGRRRCPSAQTAQPPGGCTAQRADCAHAFLPARERGAAGELAEALRRGVAHGGPSAETRLFEWETRKPSEWTEAEQAEAAELGHRPRRRDRKRATGAERADAAHASGAGAAAGPGRRPPRRPHPAAAAPWLAAVLAAALTLGLWPEETGWVRTGNAPTEHDAVSLAEGARSSSSAPEKPPAEGPIGMELPKKPRPGQLRPDANGRCPAKKSSSTEVAGSRWTSPPRNASSMASRTRATVISPSTCPRTGPPRRPRRNE